MLDTYVCRRCGYRGDEALDITEITRLNPDGGTIERTIYLCPDPDCGAELVNPWEEEPY